MKQLDLRQVGTIIGLPIYVDVAGVKEFVEKRSSNSKLVIGERDRKTLLVTTLLQKAFDMPLGKTDRVKRPRKKKTDEIPVLPGQLELIDGE